MNRLPLHPALGALCALLCLLACRATAPVGEAVVDDLGRRVVVPPSPRRVVSLAPSNTELVFALGAGDRLVGRTEACDFPEEAARVPSMGTLFPPDHERLVAARPDLVLMIEGHAELRAWLEGRGVAVLVLQPRDIDGIFAHITLLGRLLERPAEATALATRLRAELATIRPAPGQPKVLYEVWPDPLTSAGRGTFPDALIRRAGGENVVTAEGWPTVELEAVVRAGPQVIVAANQASAEAIRSGQRPGLSSTPAARGGRVVVPPNADWLARPGPRVVRGVRWLAEVLGEGAVLP